jgi:TRAP-type transport system periplasmic protein
MTRRIALAAAALAACLAGQAAAETTTLKFSTTMPPVDPAIKEGVLPLLDAIAKDSGGTIKFQSFTGGQLTANPMKLMDAMTSGLDDVTIIIASYVPQLFPDASLFALPDVVRSTEEAAYGGWKMYQAGLLRGMDKIHTLAVFSNDPGSIFTARKVSVLADLKGLKIRVSGPAEAQIVTALGGAPVGMSATQVAEALSRGLYDGTLNGWSVNSAFRATPLIKSAFDMSLGVRQFFLAMNKGVYDKLPPPARHAIDRHSGEGLSLEMARLFARTGDADRAQAKASGSFVTLTPDEHARLAAIYRPLVEKWVKDTPDGAKKLAFLEAALADYRKSH